MSQAGCTSTGLREAREGVRRLSPAVTSRLRGVALATGARVTARAKANLRRQTKGTGATADMIWMFEDAAKREVRVNSTAPQNRIKNGKVVEPPLNLPLWLEFGTVHMAARPYMGPAAWAEADRYRRDLEIAAIEGAEEALG